MIKTIIFVNCNYKEILSKLLQEQTAPETQIVVIPPSLQHPLPLKTIQLAPHSHKKLLQTIQGTQLDIHLCTQHREIEVILTLILAHVYSLAKIKQITTKNGAIDSATIEALQPGLTERTQQILTQLPDRIAGLNRLAHTMKINPAQLSKTIKQLAEKGLISVSRRKPLQAKKTQTALTLTHIIRLRQETRPRAP